MKEAQCATERVEVTNESSLLSLPDSMANLQYISNISSSSSPSAQIYIGLQCPLLTCSKEHSFLW